MSSGAQTSTRVNGTLDMCIFWIGSDFFFGSRSRHFIKVLPKVVAFVNNKCSGRGGRGGSSNGMVLVVVMLVVVLVVVVLVVVVVEVEVEKEWKEEEKEKIKEMKKKNDINFCKN